MGKMQKSKGARGERELAKKLSEVLGCEAKRGRQFAGSPDSPDVITSIKGLHIECKRTEQFRMWDALDQATRDAGDNKVPVVCHRKNNKDWVLVVKLDDLPKLMEVLNNEKGGDK